MNFLPREGKWYFLSLSISKGTNGYEDALFEPLRVKIGSAVSAVAFQMESNNELVKNGQKLVVDLQAGICPVPFPLNRSPPKLAWGSCRLWLT